MKPTIIKFRNYIVYKHAEDEFEICSAENEVLFFTTSFEEIKPRVDEFELALAHMEFLNSNFKNVRVNFGWVQAQESITSKLYNHPSVFSVTTTRKEEGFFEHQEN